MKVNECTQEILLASRMNAKMKNWTAVNRQIEEFKKLDDAELSYTIYEDMPPLKDEILKFLRNKVNVS